ncbi:MAG: carboxymuconolactone decarboxylase family protein [Bdellovibrionaceae bacterium]|nr:carboxymuconolactone decarboxylase family protein [Pseudobdellovibrionaceae bacterium]
MNTLKPLTIETAPDNSKDTLQGIQKAFGFIPNLMATFANSPAVLNGYMGLDAAWSKSSLTPKEQQIILLATSVENSCRYCIAAHSTILTGMMKVDADTVQAIRGKKQLQDARLNALVQFTREVVAERGYASENTKLNFLKVGYTEVVMMEVLVGIALKTVSNYLDHLNPTPIDEAFAAEA